MSVVTVLRKYPALLLIASYELGFRCGYKRGKMIGRLEGLGVVAAAVREVKNRAKS